MWNGYGHASMVNYITWQYAKNTVLHNHVVRTPVTVICQECSTAHLGLALQSTRQLHKNWLDVAEHWGMGVACKENTCAYLHVKFLLYWSLISSAAIIFWNCWYSLYHHHNLCLKSKYCSHPAAVSSKRAHSQIDGWPWKCTPTATSMLLSA